MDYIADRAPEGWRGEHGGSVAPDEESVGFGPSSDSEEVDSTARKSAWARLPARVYEVDPLVCSERGSPMKAIAVVQDTDEIKHILRHLITIGRAPPRLDESSVNCAPPADVEPELVQRGAEVPPRGAR
jgi:hypothetical protein